MNLLLGSFFFWRTTSISLIPKYKRIAKKIPGGDFMK